MWKFCNKALSLSTIGTLEQTTEVREVNDGIACRESIIGHKLSNIMNER